MISKNYAVCVCNGMGAQVKAYGVWSSSFLTYLNCAIDIIGVVAIISTGELLPFIEEKVEYQYDF